jgi:uncharacterized cofD-like protein
MHNLEQTSRQNLVIMGGGSIAALSAGLAEALPDHFVTRVITASDDGSVTGDLARKYGTLPTGDFRKALSAGAASESLGYLHEVRFGQDATLDDLQKRGDDFLEELSASNSLVNMHRAESVMQNAVELGKEQDTLYKTALGHLLLTSLALTHNNDMGKAIDEVGSMLMISGRIVPATLTPHTLMMNDGGTIIAGESNIDHYVPRYPDRVKLWLSPSVVINPDADTAIREASNVVIGPGSERTSLIPTLLPEGTPAALQGKRLIVIGNAEQEFSAPHEQSEDSGEIFLRNIERYAGRKCNVLICHDPQSGITSTKQLTYRPERLESEGRKVIRKGILKNADVQDKHTSEVVHDPVAIAKAYDLAIA